MSELRDVLETAVADGSVPGAVGLVARDDRIEVQAVGSADVQGTAPMARDSIFRIASITKPITAAAVMMLVEDGRIALADQWSSPPAFPSAAGGLVSTADNWLRFAQMLLAGGTFGDRRLLSPESVRQMTTDHLTARQRDASTLFLEAQGWGFGGSVDVAAIDPWNMPGRYGWVGGTGTAAHITPSAGAVAILLTQVQLAGPTPAALMRDFWRYAATAWT